jgi:hypothetical protein
VQEYLLSKEKKIQKSTGTPGGTVNVAEKRNRFQKLLGVAESRLVGTLTQDKFFTFEELRQYYKKDIIPGATKQLFSKQDVLRDIKLKSGKTVAEAQQEQFFKARQEQKEGIAQFGKLVEQTKGDDLSFTQRLGRFVANVPELQETRGQVILSSVKSGGVQTVQDVTDYPALSIVSLAVGGKLISMAASAAPTLTRVAVGGYEAFQIARQPSIEDKLTAAGQFFLFDVAVEGLLEVNARASKRTGEDFITKKGRDVLDKLSNEKPGDVVIRESQSVRRSDFVGKSDVVTETPDLKRTDFQKEATQFVRRDIDEPGVLTFETQPSRSGFKGSGVITRDGSQFATLRGKFKGADVVITQEVTPQGKRTTRITEGDELIARFTDKPGKPDIVFTEPEIVSKESNFIKSEQGQFTREGRIQTEVLTKTSQGISNVEKKPVRKTFAPKR